MTMDIKNFYLNNPLKHYEYLWLKLADISEDVKMHNELNGKAAMDGVVYVEVRKGMYGLLQAGLLAEELQG